MTTAIRSDSEIPSRAQFVAVVLAALVVYSINVDFTLYGDAAMYADYVVLRKFDELTLHIGYYVALFATDFVLSATFGIPIEQSAAWLNVCAGALSVGVTYLLGHELLATRRDALLCAGIFALSGRVLNNATSSEVYMLQTLFLLLSFYWFVREKTLSSSLAGAVALLVSPLSAFAFAFFPMYELQRCSGSRWKRLGTFALGILVVYVPYLAVHGTELFFGARGLLSISNQAPLDLLEALRRFPLYQFKAFSFLLLLMVPLLLAASRNRRVLTLAIAVAVPHMYIIAKLPAEDNVFILPTDALFAVLLAVGWREIATWRFGSAIGPTLFAGHVVLYLASGQLHGFRTNQGYADEMRRVRSRYLQDEQSILITDWGRATALTFLSRTTPDTTILQERLFSDQLFVIEDEPQAAGSRLLGRPIFLLDAWQPAPLARALRPQATLAKVRREHSIVSMAERRFGLQCTLIEETYHRIYRCNLPSP